jgi:hypothetical protein
LKEKEKRGKVNGKSRLKNQQNKCKKVLNKGKKTWLCILCVEQVPTRWFGLYFSP